MESFPQLHNVSSDFFLQTHVGSSDLANLRLTWQESGLVVRVVRGHKMRTEAEVFDEFASACQFPYYFGENWAAFDECIADLDWIPGFTNGIVVAIDNAGQVAADDDDDVLRLLINCLRSAGEEFGRPIELGEWWDRAPVPFHVVLQCRSDDELGRWRDAGLISVDLD